MLIDTHAHLDDERLVNDLPAVLERARDAGVVNVLTIGIDASTSRANVALADAHPILFAAVGIQPNHVADAQASDWDALLDLAKQPKVIAIGETGLDRYWDRAPFPLQEEYFARHLQLARMLDKPVVIHCREAEADVVRMLRTEFENQGPIRGIMHSFAGNEATARECLAMGLHISFAGMLTFKNSEPLRKVAATIPLDRLLVETDSPYLAPMPYRGKRNEPAFVAHTAACLAQIFALPFEALSEQTTGNARRLLRI